MSISRRLGKYKRIHPCDGLYRSENEQMKATYVNKGELPQNVTLRGKKSKAQKNPNSMIPLM